ncbi:membrane protein insertase YidC [Porphyromonas cangingivalis]|uniref:Membrane protein insertase YidC n=2 Tax=Porphyromonas cangingivalis TaxID=36874 RepID=A0A1T4KI10_PORCN|nr:membrane protein insertase YidC [Porphyromonas cangingivalis]SJZ42044.1 YidC/Oxa1 family membrane protein insertase [Porphyromonas cangingivalis]VEJ02659.1 Oxa1Ec [Porphyromonas cangingivalis]
MDRNTIIGFVLMGAVLVLFTWLGRPSEEQLAEQQRYNDSIAAVQQKKEAEATLIAETAPTTLPLTEMSDSALIAERMRVFGDLAQATSGTEETLTLENDSISISLSTKGGMIVSSELKKYKDYRGENVRLIREGEAEFNYTFITNTNRIINTKDLFFSPRRVDDKTIRMSLITENGRELAFVYRLTDRYRVNVQVENKGFEQVIASNAFYLDGQIKLPIYQNEKSRKTESNYSGLAYEHSSGDVEKLNTGKDVKEDISGSVKWIAFRDMFFSTIVYSDLGLESVSLNSKLNSDENHLKMLESKFVLPLGKTGEAQPMLTMYLGPNDYSLLKSIDADMGRDTQFAKIVDMGDWFRFINIWLVIPVFNFLETMFSNYGLIIFLLTLFIKLLLSPFTYKSFIAQAKMRVLRPQVEEINKKYPGDDNMMQRQRATMELYKRAGASSLGGCLPMLLQMPFLIAMYQYFPTSINLRGESFLWASDLSTYDDIIHLPFEIPFIGSHISLFCLLMTITQVIYMKISQANQPDAPGMQAMKLMPYMMSIMLFVFLNQNASGLSYYYLLSMLISIAQTGVFRLAINEKKLLAQMEENKKKPMKKSKFMQRLEEMQKQQMELQKQQKRK